jgi:hypothetical protein
MNRPMHLPVITAPRRAGAAPRRSDTTLPWRHLRRLAAAATLGAALAGAAAQDYSPAERALFMSNQFASLRPPATLRYRYTKSGTMEQGFEDQVSVHLRGQADGKCCSASTEFLGGARRLTLPEVESADGNPVILYFLERDIREMNRLTKGQSNYFRKRIRMAVYQGAKIRELNLPYRGKTVAARQITISPYDDDPLRARFAKLAGKRYVFTLSDGVPGGVYAIRTRVDGEAPGAAPLIVEEMVLEGATAAHNP